MKRIANFRFLLALTLLAGAAFGLSFRASSETGNKKVEFTHFVSGIVMENGVEYYQLTDRPSDVCGQPGPEVCEISTSNTNTDKIPVDDATPINWRP